MMQSTAIVLMQIDRVCSDAIHCYCFNADRNFVWWYYTANNLIRLECLCCDAVHCIFITADRHSILVMLSTDIVLKHLDCVFRDAVNWYCLNEDGQSVKWCCPLLLS